MQVKTSIGFEKDFIYSKFVQSKPIGKLLSTATLNSAKIWFSIGATNAEHNLKCYNKVVTEVANKI